MTKAIIKKPLTEKEKKFCEIYVENYFSQLNKTNTRIAVEAGYAEDSAYQRAHENLNPRIKPNVRMFIEQMLEEHREANNITKDKHMSRLHNLGQKAEKKEMYGVAVNAEVQRGKAAGYYIDKKIIKSEKQYEDMTADELDVELKDITEKWALIAGTKEEDDKSKE